MSQYSIATISNRIPREWYYLQAQFYKSLGDFPVSTINYPELPWLGLTTKVRWLYKAIKDGELTGKKLIYTDSWDMVFTTSPDEVIERYISFNSDIVIGCEKNCFPTTYKDEYDKKEYPTPYKYLNSGFIVGTTDAIFSCLEAMDLDNVPGDYYDTERQCNVHPEDQTLWMQMLIRQPVSIELDHYQILNQTLHEARIDEFDFSEKRIRNKNTGSYPCTIHFNGNAKDRLDLRNPILTHLNLL